MTEVGNVYGESLYELAKDESLAKQIGEQLAVLQASFRQEPDFIRLLSSPNLTKAERCQILDDSFRGKVHPYLLNFLKIWNNLFRQIKRLFLYSWFVRFKHSFCSEQNISFLYLLLNFFCQTVFIPHTNSSKTNFHLIFYLYFLLTNFF